MPLACPPHPGPLCSQLPPHVGPHPTLLLADPNLLAHLGLSCSLTSPLHHPGLLQPPWERRPVCGGPAALCAPAPPTVALRLAGGGRCLLPAPQPSQGLIPAHVAAASHPRGRCSELHEAPHRAAAAVLPGAEECARGQPAPLAGRSQRRLLWKAPAVGGRPRGPPGPAKGAVRLRSLGPRRGRPETSVLRAMSAALRRRQ